MIVNECNSHLSEQKVGHCSNNSHQHLWIHIVIEPFSASLLLPLTVGAMDTYTIDKK